MSKLDKIMLDRFDEQIMSYQDEKEVRNELNKFYHHLIDETPNFKYIVSSWIMNNNDLIKELDISIQYLQYEKNEFIKNNGLQYSK